MREQPRVLVVDDNATNRFLLSRLSSSLGFSVDEAENGQAAVAKALTGAYAVILMDLAMPVMDGMEATRRLRAEGVTTPVIAVSAHIGSDDRLDLAEAGFDGAVPKPVDFPALTQYLTAAL